ncbi:fasciclin domain-containing protein [Flavihumibacter rivuli]|uniref:fasciclin domain-containing protein n=1 Tax=Flavihumibacter rivuli TaxID=2838156 RepID=UPI001BDEF7D1|nr:fasciclin domain-containing protein [Flavihumibacter rivuli]ULQ57675.1 fasciclin domain-containing protein [Flavihumibacter rivuli]
MLSIIKKFSRSGLIIAGAMSMLAACNKVPEVEDIAPVTPPSGQTIAEIIDTDPNYSLLKQAVAKAGVGPILAKRDSKLTLFAPDNDAMALSGISSGVINALPAAQLAAILSYHLVPQAVPAANIPESFPNVQMPTFLQPDPTQPLFKLSIFPSRRGNVAFANNIPIKAADKIAANGVIHTPFALIAPPSRVLADTIARDTTLSYLMAAIARADQGLPDGSKFAQYLSNPLVNFTVFAPDNNAFRNLLAFLNLPTDITSIGALPIQTVQGILAYHVHVADVTFPLNPSKIKFARVFSVNLPATPTQVKSLLSGFASPAPPLVVDATQGVKGFVNPTFSKIIGADRNCVNGVFHKIDQVLLPSL